METHSGKVITTANIKQIFKKEIKSESVMPLQIECATCTPACWLYQLKTAMYFFLGQLYLTLHVFLFINRVLSIRTHVADIL